MRTKFILFYIVALIYLMLPVTHAQIVSDDFFPETTIQSPWRFFNPASDGSLTLTGTNAEIIVPSGSAHDLWNTNNNAPRMLQPAPDNDFQIEVKFESVPSSSIQLQGLIVQQDDDTYLRFGTYYSTSANLFSALSEF